MSEQTATGAVQTGLFPDNREVLTRKTTQNNVTFWDGGVGVRIYLGNILIVNNIAEIGGKGFARPFCKIVSPYCFISFHVKAIVKASTAGKDRNNSRLS